MSSVERTGRTGQVFLEDYDLGLATTIGGELVNIMLDGEEVQQYAVRIEGVTGPDLTSGLVPVIFSESEMAYQEQLIPQIVISRGSITPDMHRWHPGGREYFVPAEGSEQVQSNSPDGRKMANRVEIKWYAFPYEITYDVHLRGRLRIQADRMLKHVGKSFWSYGQIFLTDSEGDERGYYAFTDSFDSLNDIGDVAERLIGHTISLRVEAELDFRDPFIAPTTPVFDLNVTPGVG